MGLHFLTLYGWRNFLDAPEAAVYILYVVLKLFLLLLVGINLLSKCKWFTCCVWKKKISGKKINCEEGCKQCYLNCCSNFCDRHGIWIRYNIWKYFMKFCCMTVDTLFRTLQRSDEYQEEDDNHGLQILYIRNIRIMYMDIIVMALAIVTFLLAAFTTFWDGFWLDITEGQCIMDQDIYCYPISTSDDTTVNTATWITNCSEWITLNDEMKVTFKCYQFKYALRDALAVVGGLITIFTVTTKLGAKKLMSMAVALFGSHKSGCKELCFKNCCCIYTCKSMPSHRQWGLRLAVAFVFALTEITLSTTAAAIYIDDALGTTLYSGSRGVHSKRAALAVFHNLNKFLVPLGVISTSLFLEIEYYAQELSNFTREPVPFPCSQYIDNEFGLVVVEKYSITSSAESELDDKDHTEHQIIPISGSTEQIIESNIT